MVVQLLLGAMVLASLHALRKEVRPTTVAQVLSLTASLLCWKRGGPVKRVAPPSLTC